MAIHGEIQNSSSDDIINCCFQMTKIELNIKAELITQGQSIESEEQLSAVNKIMSNTILQFLTRNLPTDF